MRVPEYFEKPYLDSFRSMNDAEKAPYTAEHIWKYIEIYRRLRQVEWATTAELAEWTGTSRRHVRRLLEAFALAGYIELRRGHFGGKDRATRVRLKKDKR